MNLSWCTAVTTLALWERGAQELEEFEGRRVQLALRYSVEEATADRDAKKNQRHVKAGDYPAGIEGGNLCRLCFDALKAHIKRALVIRRAGANVIKSLGELPDTAATASLKRTLGNLSHDEIAGVTLGALTQSIYDRDPDTDSAEMLTHLAIGEAIKRKCDEAGLCRTPMRRAYVAARNKSDGARARALATLARAAGYRAPTWSKPEKIRAGSWLLDRCYEALPDVFYAREDGAPDVYPDALDRASEFAVGTNKYRPVVHPQALPPQPWTRWLNEYRVPFIKRDQAEASVSAAMAEGSMQPHLDGVNAVQAVEWYTNPKMVDAMRDHAGDFLAAKVEREPYESDHKFQHRVKQARLRAIIDVAGAYRLWRFYTPARCDWRGRIYPIPHLNRTREDHARSLFRFARGKPLGDHGLFWLKVQVANTFGVNRVSFADRAAWVDKHHEQILAAPSTGWWKEADDKHRLQFLAACHEYADALAAGPAFETRLPISLDCTCSGLQHMTAMTRSLEGLLVNLGPSDTPQDVYSVVAERLRVKLEADPDPLARVALDTLCIDRGLTKTPTMTYGYSATQDGMRPKLHQQIIKAGHDDDLAYSLSVLLAKHMFAAIKESVLDPHNVMDYLQKLVRKMEKIGKPLRGVTPSGLPWTNGYYEPRIETVDYFTARGRRQHKVTVGDTNTIASNKAKRSVTANLVHGCDASLLAFTAAACRREDIEIGVNHDCFAVLAPDVPRFNQIVRGEFVNMYEQHDVLADIRASAERDGGTDLPEVPLRGALDLRGVLKAEYFVH